MLVCRGGGGTATRAMVSMNGVSQFQRLDSAYHALGAVSSLGLGEGQVSAEVTPRGAALAFGSGWWRLWCKESLYITGAKDCPEPLLRSASNTGSALGESKLIGALSSAYV